MSAVRLVPRVGLVLLLVCGLCDGQSLGDAARLNRQQKKTERYDRQKSLYHGRHERARACTCSGAS